MSSQISRELLVLAIRWNAMCARAKDLRGSCEDRRAYQHGDCCDLHRAHYAVVHELIEECHAFSPPGYKGAVANAHWWKQVGFKSNPATSAVLVCEDTAS